MDFKENGNLIPFQAARLDPWKIQCIYLKNDLLTAEVNWIMFVLLLLFIAVVVVVLLFEEHRCIQLWVTILID